MFIDIHTKPWWSLQQVGRCRPASSTTTAKPVTALPASLASNSQRHYTGFPSIAQLEAEITLATTTHTEDEAINPKDLTESCFHTLKTRILEQTTFFHRALAQIFATESIMQILSPVPKPFNDTLLDPVRLAKRPES